MAEGIMQEIIREKQLDWEVDSAGTNGYHVGESPHPLSQKVAAIHGIDISNQVARRFVKEDLQRFDRIYAMANDVIDDIRRIAGQAFDKEKVSLLPGNLEIPDPWYGAENGYHTVFDMIMRACRQIASYDNENKSREHR